MDLLSKISLETDLPVKTVKQIFDRLTETIKNHLQNSDEVMEIFGISLYAKNHEAFERKKRNGEPSTIPAQRRIKASFSDELIAGIQGNVQKKASFADEVAKIPQKSEITSELKPALVPPAIPGRPHPVTGEMVLPPPPPPPKEKIWHVWLGNASVPVVESEMLKRGCSDDTLIWTENGWKKIGEVMELNYIFGY